MATPSKLRRVYHAAIAEMTARGGSARAHVSRFDADGAVVFVSLEPADNETCVAVERAVEAAGGYLLGARAVKLDVYLRALRAALDPNHVHEPGRARVAASPYSNAWSSTAPSPCSASGDDTSIAVPPLVLRARVTCQPSHASATWPRRSTSTASVLPERTSTRPARSAPPAAYHGAPIARLRTPSPFEIVERRDDAAVELAVLLRLEAMDCRAGLARDEADLAAARRRRISRRADREDPRRHRRRDRPCR